MRVTKTFYSKDPVWRTRLKDLTGFRLVRVKFYRVLLLSLRGFFENQVRASALTYFSILSVVPVFALVFGIARGFGYEKFLQRELLERMPGQEEVVSRITQFAHSLLEETQGGVIAGMGLIFLFYSVISVLMSIENSFNEIWHISEGRPFKRKVTDYLSFMLIAPVLFLLSSGLTVFIATQVKTVVQKIEILDMVGPGIFYLLNLTPYFTIWLLFTFMYVFMPSTEVKFASGALAALMAGTVFQLFQWAYITLQIGVSRYNAIYGSFAALPIFLVWLQLSWVITLLGAEFAYAYQNADLYDYEKDCKESSLSFQRLLSLRVVQLVACSFSAGEPPCDKAAIESKTKIPPILLNRILEDLIAAKILSRVKPEGAGGEAFQPAHSIEDATIKGVIVEMERLGTNHIPMVESEELEKISSALRSFEELIEGSPENKRLTDL